MQKNLNLSIPKPCSEKWENFTTTSSGGFCSSCSKVVVDFTKKGDDEIAIFFKNKPAHACGRFRPDQLKLYLLTTPPEINPGFALLKAGILSLLFLLVSKPASSQRMPEKSKTEVATQSNNRPETQYAVNDFTIKGVVLSAEDDLPLPGVNIILKGAAIGATTEADGSFEFPQKLKEGDVLIFCFIGLQSKEYRVPKPDKNATEIQMELNIEMDLDMDITGEVAVNEIYTPRQSGLQRFMLKVKQIF